MTYFTQDSTNFLQNLSRNNNRDWFNAHKSDYESYIKAPAKLFADHMSVALSELTGHDYKAKIFRIYRDVRFSKDKTPYNTHQRISFIPDIEPNPPGWFFSLEKDHLILGAGDYAFDKSTLENWRRWVAGKDGARLLAMIGDLQAKGLRFSEPELKRTPRGYDTDHPHAALLRRKGLAVWMDFDDAKPALGEASIKHCLAGYHAMRPVFDQLLTLATSETP